MSSLERKLTTERLAAIRLAEDRLGVTLSGNGDSETTAPWQRNPRARLRAVTLSDRWWDGQDLPLPALVGPYESPSVAARGVDGRIYVHDPVTGQAEATNRTAGPAQFGRAAEAIVRELPHPPLLSSVFSRFLLKGSAKGFFVLLLMAGFAALLGLYQPLAIARVFGEVIPSKDLSGLLLWVAGFGVITLMLALLEFGRSVILLRIVLGIDQRLSLALYDRLLRAPLSFFRRFPAADLALKALDVSTLRQVVGPLVITAVVGIGFAVANFAFMLWISTSFAVYSLIIVLAISAVTYFLARKQVGFELRTSEQEAQIASLLSEAFRHARYLAEVGAEERLFKHWDEMNSVMLEFVRKGSLFISLSTATRNAFMFFAPAVLFALALTYPSLLSLPEFLAFFAAFGQMLFAVLALTEMTVSVIRIAAPYNRLKPILNLRPEEDAGLARPNFRDNSLRVSNVRFRYGPTEVHAVDNVSLNLSSGGVVAITGPSGSGKSTLLQLMLGLETAESGDVCFGDQFLRDLNKEHLRQEIGVVIQDPPMFEGTVGDAILGAGENDAAALEKVLQMVGLDSLPQGLETKMGSGSDLSPGDLQRIELARVLLRKPRFVFLDEATTALEASVLDAILGEFRAAGTTCVIVTHQIDVMEAADQVVFLRNGKIRAKGSYRFLTVSSDEFIGFTARG